jgi:hypothetical protein
MKEKEFTRYVKQEKDLYRKLPRTGRGNINKYIRDFCDKEVAMKTDHEWNVMSPEDTMVMALVNLLEDKDSNSSNETKTKPKSTNPSTDKESKPEKKPLSNEEKAKRRDAKIPDWKKVPPKEGESSTIVKDNRTYHYCTKCRNGKGMWALHTTDQHSSNYKAPSSPGRSEKREKTVTFESPKSSSDEPSIKIKKNLLTNAKAYLAQFTDQDFQEGGSEN